MIYCNKCGKECLDTAKFCPRCGEKIEDVSPNIEPNINVNNRAEPGKKSKKKLIIGIGIVSIVIIAVVVTILLLCTGKKTSDKNSIKQLLAEYEKAVNEKDYDKILELYAPKEVLNEIYNKEYMDEEDRMDEEELMDDIKSGCKRINKINIELKDYFKYQPELEKEYKQNLAKNSPIAAKGLEGIYNLDTEVNKNVNNRMINKNEESMIYKFNGKLYLGKYMYCIFSYDDEDDDFDE